MEGKKEGGYQSRCIGCFLGAMAGDILGAPVEGYSADSIKAEFPNGPLRDFFDMRQLSTFRLAAEQGWLEDEAEATASKLGIYTDDTSGIIAIASSLIEMKGLEPEHIAFSLAAMWKRNPDKVSILH